MTVGLISSIRASPKTDEQMIVTPPSNSLGGVRVLQQQRPSNIIIAILTAFFAIQLTRAAEIALARTSPEYLQEALPALIEGAHPDREMSIPCADALAEIGPVASNALPALRDLLSTGSVLRRAARVAIQRIA